MSSTINQRYEILIIIYSEFDVYGNPILTSGTTYMLDTYESEMYTLNMSINEIQDISNRNSSYSHPIVLPLTDNNNTVFGYISQLNMDTGFYNPNKRAACQILVDTIPIYVGTLQLKDVITNYKTGEMKLETIFYSSAVDFYRSMGERYLQDLTGASGPSASVYGVNSGENIGLNVLNHQYNIFNVMASWEGNVGFYYPLIDYGISFTQSGIQPISTSLTSANMSGGTNSITIQNFYPGVFVKNIVDEIFKECGYQYTSNFFNSDFFKKLIVPFTNKTLVSGPEDSISLNADQTFNDIEGQFQNVYNFYSGPPDNTFINYCSIIGLTGIGGPIMSVNVPYYPPQSGHSGNINVQYYENDTGGAIFYKPYISINMIGLTNSVWTYGATSSPTHSNVPLANLFTGDTYQYSYIYSEISINWCIVPNGLTTPILITSQNLYLNKFGFTIPQYATSNDNIFSTNGYFDLTLSDYRPNNLINSLGYYNLQSGDRSFIYFTTYSFAWIAPSGNYYYSMPLLNQLPFKLINTYISHKVSPLVLPGGWVNIPANLPAKIKQKDFITNLYNLYNLYVEPLKSNPKILNIEPRDYYYTHNVNTGSVVVKDWTYKIDLEQDISMTILSNTQAKTKVHTYKLDSDYYNTYYHSYTNRTSGDTIIEIDNDFNTDVDKLEVIFGSNQLVNIPGMYSFPILNYANQIDPSTNAPIGFTDESIKILQVAGTTSLPTFNGSSLTASMNVVPLPYDQWSMKDQYGFSFTFSYYPYAGNYDNPYYPTVDLNFSQQLLHLYPQTQVVTNNLFNTYYSNQFNELNDLSSRLLTCEMYLTPNDIQQFLFSDIIYLELGGTGRYWRVNSIKNYDLSGRSTTTVELLSVLNNDYHKPYYPAAPTASITSSTTTTTTTAASTTTTTTTAPGTTTTSSTTTTTTAASTTTTSSTTTTTTAAGVRLLVYGKMSSTTGGPYYMYWSVDGGSSYTQLPTVLTTTCQLLGYTDYESLGITFTLVATNIDPLSGGYSTNVTSGGGTCPPTGTSNTITPASDGTLTVWATGNESGGIA